MDFAAEGLLDGLEGAARRQREELLNWLLAEGFTLEQIAQADSPMMLPAERIIAPGERVSARQIAETVGMPVEQLLELRRAQGIPTTDDLDGAVLAASDLQGARVVKSFLDAGLAFEDILAVARVLGHGLAQAAEVMRQTVLSAVLHPGATEREIAESYSAVVEQLAPLLGPMIDDLLGLHLRHMVATEAVSAAELAAGTLPGSREVAVLFADVVGFTRMGEERDPTALQGVAAWLADIARGVAHPPVRFIKTIGDAVMLVSPEPEALLHAGLGLLAETEAGGDEAPQLRVGMALGHAVSRAGDWFGAPVNLASRVTAVARPGSFLVAESARAALDDLDGVSWSFAGERRLKNVRGEVKLFRARASAPSGR